LAKELSLYLIEQLTMSLIEKFITMNNVIRKVGRDSGNGQFIPIKETQRRPKTTEVEKIRYPAPKK